MRFLIITLLFTSLAHAHGTHGNHRRLASAINVLQNPTTASNNLCVETEPEPGAWCENLSTAICERSSASALNETYVEELAGRFFGELPPDASDRVQSRAHMRAINAAESEIGQSSGITNDDLNKLTNDIRTTMMREVNSSPIPDDQKAKMSTQLSELTFRSAQDLVTAYKGNIVRDNPDYPAEDAETDAIKYYVEVCGVDGLELNAFYDPYTNSFVICPGLVQSYSKLGDTKEADLNALTFVMAHEIGHCIDGSVIMSDDQPLIDPSIYDSMGSCYSSLDSSFSWEVQRGEIVSDFWATKVLADRIKTQNLVGEEAFTPVEAGINGLGLCEVGGDETHPAGDFRMNNTIARDPGIRARLECEAPTQEQQYCGINGAQPPRPAVAAQP